ncbi:chloroquine resistance marker protein [Plasmodium falciparum RAJ116]|uniref:Chloroquine resistance marker protein n=1 Tax=Plasmodium falciparum RAJ116 TaxID=580058 RepID=A0A0L0CWW9_PLAFA|nr:chloroquine resistance marker protein [Plasmodium falciparum RAJ116]
MKIVQAPFFSFFFFLFPVFCFFQCYGIYKNKKISKAFLIHKKEGGGKAFASNFRSKSKISNRSNKLNEHINNIHVGQIKLGYIYDIKDNDIYVKLKDKDRNVVIKKENNYLLENKLLYDYLYDRNLINDVLYNKISHENCKDVKDNRKDIQDHYKKQTNPCVVLIKEVNEKNDEILGELYYNEISKRKDKIFDKLNELKSMEKKIFIKILKNVRNKYYIVLINDCIKGYLLYDEKLNLSEQLHKNIDTYYNKKFNEKYDDQKKSKNINNELIYNNSKRLSAYIIDVNKKLEYVFLSLYKYPENILNQKLEDIQHTILQENLFENNYFKAEVTDYCNNGNNIIVKIFENKNASIRVKIKSHNIINTRNILRNFDYLKNKVITHEFNKYFTNMDDLIHQNVAKGNINKNLINQEIYAKEKNIQSNEKNYNNHDNSNDINSNVNKSNDNSSSYKNIAKKKKDYIEKFKQFKDQYYGCKDVDALKYINVDDYIYKREKLLYVRIINKTLDRNVYEGSMVHSEIINKNIYDIIKQITNKNNICINYDAKLRYPSKVIAFFNNFVILSTKILKTDILTDIIKNQESNKINDKSKLPNIVEKDVITLIEKRYIDHENLKVGDIFFCRFENVKRQSIRNVFNLSNSAIINIYNTFFKKDKDSYIVPSKYKEEQHMLHDEIKQKETKKQQQQQQKKKKIYINSSSTNEDINIVNNIDTKNQEDGNQKSTTEYVNKNINQHTFEELFFEKYDIYFMKAELHKDTEYRLNKNNIDKNFKLLKNICDNYLSGFNKSYDVNVSEDQLTLKSLKKIKKKKKYIEGSPQEGESFHSSLYDVENNQIRKILYMIKEDLEKQKKKNKLDEVDKEYEEEQKTHIDATEYHKNLPELEEMNKLSEDVFYMKLPFVE